MSDGTLENAVLENHNTFSIFPTSGFDANCHDPKLEFQERVKVKIARRKHFLSQLLRKKPPSFLLDCDEALLRDYIGQHRLLPEGLRIDLVLERAFRKQARTNIDDSLFNLFEKDYILKGGDIHDLLYEGFSFDSDGETEPEDRPPEAELSESKLIPKALVMWRKISICEIVLKILRGGSIETSSSESSNSGQLMEPIDEMLQNLPKKLRVTQTPSYERLREKMLHEMHVERRPLSWFAKRCQYFGKRTKKIILPSPPKEVVISPVTKPFGDDMNKITKEAVKSLLATQRSQVYENFHNPEEILLEKLVKTMKQVSIAKKQLQYRTSESCKSSCGSASESLQEHPDESSSFNKCVVDCLEENPNEISREKRVHLYQHFKKMLSHAENIVHSNELIVKTEYLLKQIWTLLQDQEHFSCLDQGIMCEYKRRIGGFLLSQDNEDYFASEEAMKDFTELFKEVSEKIFGDTSLAEDNPKSEHDEDSNDKGKKNIFQSYLIWDDEQESQLMKHLRRGLKHEYYYLSNFVTVWKDSILTGLCLFNNEIQIMERGRIFIRNQKSKRVRIMSGGRVGPAGPMYPEFVSEGMLDCAVLGTQKSPPTVDYILQGILSLATDDGVLIIIMNDPEIRYNFLLAASVAKTYGAYVEVVLAADGLSISEGMSLNEKHGSVGIVVKFKVAAAMALDGATLNTIVKTCQFMSMVSVSCKMIDLYTYIGCDFQSGSRNSGLKTDLKDVISIEREMLNILTKSDGEFSFAPDPGTDIILLINYHNIYHGAIYDMLVDISVYLDDINVKLKRIYIGNFICFPGKGFSLTFVKDQNEKFSTFLDAPTLCFLWPPYRSRGTFLVKQLDADPPTLPEGVQLNFNQTDVMEDVFEGFLESVNIFSKICSGFSLDLMNQLQELVSKLQSKVLQFSQLPLHFPFLLLNAVGEEMEKIELFGKQLALLIYAASQELCQEVSGLTSRMVCKAFYRGVTSLAGYSRRIPDEGSLADALFPLAKTLDLCAQAGDNPLEIINNQVQNLKKFKITQKHAGINFCTVVLENIYNVLSEHYTDTEWDTKTEEEDTIVVALCEDENDSENIFCTHPIPQNLKSNIQQAILEARKIEPSLDNVSTSQ